MFWKLFIPISLVLVASAIGAALILPEVVQRSAAKDAIEEGQETAQQFKTLRKYYTDNVVSKILANGKLNVSYDHVGNPTTVPLPATMILDMSVLLRQTGTTLKLYSPYPFPNRRERVMDKFGEDAWTFFQTNPDRPFSRVEVVDGKTTVRVAIADRMTVPTCVACHNTLATSPKKDWKLGDVRGVLEVDSSRQLASGERVVQQVLAALAVLLALLALFLLFVYRRSIARPLAVALDAARALADGSAAKVKVVGAIANGDLEQELVPQRALPINEAELADDEVGQLLRSVHVLDLGQVALDEAIRTMAAALREGRRAELENDWHKTGQNDLNTCMRGVQETSQLATTVLSYLAKRTGACVGAFFLYDETSHQLNQVAGYGLPLDHDNTRVAEGEGLVGQAVREQRILVVTDAPASYLPVASSLGRSDPASILVVPLMHGANLVGAIELGGFKAFSPAELGFLEAVREALAVGFEVNISRKRTEALLTETEQQAEELRAQQEELQQSNEELEERAEMLERQREQLKQKGAEVEAASREIWNKAEELQRVSAYKSEFMANMSHELRTPLNSMLILSGLLQENKGGQLSDKQVEYAATIHGAGKDLLNLINDILDLSKVEAGQVEFQYEACVPAELCRSIDALFHALAEQKGLTLRWETAQEVPGQVILDVQRALQVLKNLVANAIKFTHSGGVQLTVTVPQGADNPLPVPALAFAVSDTGIGVPDEKRELIFEAFKQADGSVSRQYGGTGLGLSISLQLARRMDGTLLMQSQSGKGSTFTLYLPQHGSTPPGAAASAPHGAAGHGVASPAPGAAWPGLSSSASGPAAAPAYPRSSAAAPAPSTAPQPVPSPAHAAAPPWPAGPVQDDRASATPGGKTILIVEDDPAFARILLDRVRQRGFKGLVAQDGQGGIALAHHYRPCAVLLDVMLPIVDGWGVMRAIKDHPATANVPVHMLSGVESRRRAMELGALSFTPKPATIAELDAVLASIDAVPGSVAKKLLVVEDNAAEAAGIVALLTHHDVEITVASYGQQAISYLSEGHYDCMVLDLGLADMPGFDVLTHLHSLAEGRRIPVIVHSGRELTREQERALRRYSESIIIKGAKSADRLLDEVTLFLHMVDAQLPTPAAPAGSELGREAMLDGKTVLVVDDDVRNVFSLTSLLADKGVQVIDAENGREALERLAAHSEIDAVLMDIMMPEMDGYEAMRRIRANPAWRDLPVIAMTAKVMQGDQQKCIDAGASDYIGKPVDTAKLLTLLRVWTKR